MFFTPVMRNTSPSSLRTADHAFERFFSDALRNQAQPRSTPHYVFDQDEGASRLQIDAPGLTREQLTVSIEANVVRVESIADAPRSLKAAFELPQDIDAPASSAQLENGILTLRLVTKSPENQRVSLNIE